MDGTLSMPNGKALQHQGQMLTLLGQGPSPKEGDNNYLRP